VTTDREQIPLDAPEALHDWTAAHNLNELVYFHNVIRACLSEKMAEFGEEVIDDLVVESRLQNYMGPPRDRHLSARSPAPMAPAACLSPSSC